MEKLVDQFEYDVFDQYAEHIFKYRKCDYSTANKEAREFMRTNWIGLENKLNLIGGKMFLKEINKWLRNEYGISCSMNRIIDTFKVEDICEEMRMAITQLVSGLDIS